MTTELLYPLVSEAIRRAETLADLRAPGARSAFLDVSLLEERIAESLPASDPEGALARRGAVRAAVSAEEHERARELARRFLAEPGLDAATQGEVSRLSSLAEAASAQASHNMQHPLGAERIGESLTEMLHRLDLPSRKDILDLGLRLQELKAEVEALKAELLPPPGTPSKRVA